jgi:hypothetical protein
VEKLYRDYGVALALLAGGLILLLVLAVEGWHFQGKRTELKSRQPVKSGSTLEPLENGQDQAITLPGLEHYSDMVQRPLFMEGRRPAPEESLAAAEPPKVETGPLNLKLMGLVFTPSDKTVILVDEKNKYKRVRNNATVAGWKLVEIGEDRVVMEQSGERKELLLLKPKPKGPNFHGAPGVPGAPVTPVPPGAPGGVRGPNGQPVQNGVPRVNGPGNQTINEPDDAESEDNASDDSGDEDIQPDEANDQ